MDPPEVHVGELPRLVARGALRLLEPRDRLLELALLHQVATDIVVRVAEVGIDLDRLEALARRLLEAPLEAQGDRKSTRLNSSHTVISYAVFCLKKKKKKKTRTRTTQINN